MASTYYADMRPAISPQAGKTYRMRNGDTVGPMRFRAEKHYPWIGFIDTGMARIYTSTGLNGVDSQYDIIAEITPDADAPTAEGPVRRRTVTEIVPGVYGRLIVSAHASAVHVSMVGNNESSCWATAELRAAAAVLIALADGLDEMGGAS